VFKLKVSILGAAGRVGRATAFCLAEESVVGELMLVSRECSLDQIEGETIDMYDALAAKNIKVQIETSCQLERIENSNIVVITAGIPKVAGMSTMDLAIPNAKIVAQYAREVAKHAPESIILVVTNPVDVMTYVAYKTSGFPRKRVLGLGNHMDSLRLKNMLAKHFNVHVSEIHTRIIGEHGENMVPLLSSTSIGGILTKYFPEYSSFDVDDFIEKVKNAGVHVISKKGSTEYGPAFAIANIVNTILNDEKTILTITTYLEDEIEGVNDVCLGVPVKLGRNGVERIIRVKATDEEIKAFLLAAKSVKKYTDKAMATLGK
jgi:malate dehydrogenase